MPLHNLVIAHANAYITSHLDVSIYFVHLQDLITFKLHLENRVKALNLTQLALPSFITTSDNLDTILHSIANTLLSGLNALDHNPSCRENTRPKRELLPEQGLLPGIGRTLAWLTGTLTSDAARYINANSRNLRKLQEAQLASVKVLNHTEHAVRANSVQLQSLNRKLVHLGNKLIGDYTETHAAQLVLAYYQSFTLTLSNFQNKIDILTEEWRFATDGLLSHHLLHGPFYDHITGILDSNTLSYHNLRTIIKGTSVTSVTACRMHVYLHIAVPLLIKKPLPFYRVFLVPVPHDDSFDFLSPAPHAIAWSEEKSYQFSAKEFTNIFFTKRLAITRPPASITPLQKSCLYALTKNMQHECQLKHSPRADSYLSFINNYLAYSFELSAKLTGLFKCPHSDPVPYPLKGTSVIYVPFRCKIKVGNVVYENTKFHSTNVFLAKPTFATLHNLAPVLVSNSSFLHDNSTLSNEQYNEDMASLLVASDLLGTFEIPTEHFLISTVSLMLSFFVLFVLVIVLYLIVCGPLRRCQAKPHVQVIRMETVDKNSL